VSEAAVLCPSFYRADIIHNPNAFDRFFSGLRRAVIGFLQRRREGNRIVFAD
jgi:indolepyruvate ferredoxin oxidoreductase alpha subunit